MSPMEQLVAWSRAKQVLALVVHSRSLPLRTMYLGRLFCDPSIVKTVIFTPGGGIDGLTPGAVLLWPDLENADLQFGAQGVDGRTVVRIVLKDSPSGADGGDSIEISPQGAFGTPA